MTARRTALLLAVVLGVYLLVFVDIAVGAFRTGEPAGIGIGVGVLLLPLLALPLLLGELRFGHDSERLGRELGAEGGLPRADELPRTPSGRVDPTAADAVFAARRADVEAAPEDWRAWYRLALAYGDARDSARGRQAMKRAIALRRGERRQG